jgi:hypothetical protein
MGSLAIEKLKRLPAVVEDHVLPCSRCNVDQRLNIASLNCIDRLAVGELVVLVLFRWFARVMALLGWGGFPARVADPAIVVNPIGQAGVLRAWPRDFVLINLALVLE